jgi:hypothetical protein
VRSRKTSTERQIAPAFAGSADKPASNPDPSDIVSNDYYRPRMRANCHCLQQTLELISGGDRIRRMPGGRR